MTLPEGAPHEPIGALLARLRTVMQGQAEAINADDFEGLEHLTAEREPLVAALEHYAAADLRPEEHGLAEQVAALDQQLIALARESLNRTGQEIRDLHRGRGALNEYRRRGQTLIQNLAYLGQQDSP